MVKYERTIGGKTFDIKAPGLTHFSDEKSKGYVLFLLEEQCPTRQKCDEQAGVLQ